jgi:hypothetical protein
MKKYLCLALTVFCFYLSYKVFADEVEQKTDSSFVGYNDSFSGDNVQKQTDSEFVGAQTINAQNSYFAGDSYQQQVGNSTVAPFAGDNTFIGDDYGK